MAHFSRPSKVVIDVPDGDHDRELSFWEAALGQALSRFDYPEITAQRRTARISGC